MFRRVGEKVRLTPNSRHSKIDVCFSAENVRLFRNSRHQNLHVRFHADFVCFTPDFGRLEQGAEWSVRDPQETF